MESTKFRFARKCSFTHKPMNEGYVFNYGNFYAIDGETASKYVQSLGADWTEELKTIGTEKEWFFWTTWEEIDEDEFFDVNGERWILEGARMELIKASQNLIGAMDDNAERLWEGTLECAVDAVVMEKCKLQFDEEIEETGVTKVVDREFTGVFDPLARLEFMTNLLA